MTKRLVYICDWLPPDFGAVGQYAVLFARQWASEGWAVTLVGLTSGPSQPTGRGASGRWLARGASHPSPHLQETKVRGAASLDGCLERPAAQRSISGHAAGGCGALYRQPAADAAFHRATQSPAQETAHLSHHGLPSGMPDRRAGKQRTDSSLCCSVSRSSGDVVSMLSKCWASIRRGDLRIAELRRSGSV